MKPILDHEQIIRKIKRMAYQVYERHVEQDEIIIAGIAENGYRLAEKIAAELRSISPLRVHLCEISVAKAQPSEQTTKVSLPADQLKGRPAVIVDDVLNTARTMVYAIYPFFKSGCPTIQTAVLADRNHKNYPVAADITGISLATTLQEHVIFEIKDDGEMGLYLR